MNFFILWMNFFLQTSCKIVAHTNIILFEISVKWSSLISQKSNGAKILVKSFNVLAISGYNNPIKNFIVTSKRIACNYLYTTYCSYLSICRKFKRLWTSLNFIYLYFKNAPLLCLYKDCIKIIVWDLVIFS